MNTSAISTTAPISTPVARKPVARAVQNEAPPTLAPTHQPEVKTGVESLSLETKVELSQQAQVQPPPPPQATKKKSSTQEKLPPKGVEGEDFTGRTCTGTLNGPLLMEDPLALNFECDSPRDFETMHQLGLQLGQVPQELLHSPAGDAPLVKEAGFSYHGIGPEGARLSQHIEGEAGAPLEVSHVKLADGQVVQVTRGPNEISILVPPASLDELANWGRNLLAVA